MKKISRSILIAFSCLIASTPILANNLPDLGSPGLVIYDRQTEIQLGRAFTQALHNEVDLIQDPQVLSYIRRIGHRIAEHSQDNRNYRFYVINDSSINAFAGPDGIIGIHSGLILAADTEDELASVIAHEIAHVTQLHLARRFEQQSSMNITSFASLLAAILIGTQNPSAGIAAMMGATGLTIQEQLRHSRIHEHEADHLGIALLQKSGYNPHAMAGFFGKLAKQYQIYEYRPPEILMTHPVTENRLAQASQRAEQLEKPNPIHQPIDLALIQTRLQPETAISKTNDIQQQEAIQCYKKSLERQNAFESNLACLEQALNDFPNNRLLKTQLIEQLLKQSEDKAIDSLKKLQEIYPQDEAILLMLVDSYQTKGQNSLAQTIIFENIDKLLYQFEVYQALSQSFAHQQKLAEAYLFEAYAFYQLGNHQRARHLAEQSQKTIPKLDKKYIKHYEKLTKKLEIKHDTKPIS